MVARLKKLSPAIAGLFYLWSPLLCVFLGMQKSILLLLFPVLWVACQSQAQPAHDLDANAFEKGILQPGVQVLDVRTAGEFRSGHIAKALQADWNNPAQFQDRTQHLDKKKPVYIYCLSGGRSAAAARVLRDKGFSVFELSGGINAWKRMGKPIEAGQKTPQMTEETYNSAINSAPVVLVDFGAEWCPPCKKMEPILAELQKEMGNRFKLVKVDGGNDLNLMKKENVEALPVFIIYKNGKEVWRQQGLTNKETFKKFL